MRTQQIQAVDTLGHSLGVKQYHWNTGAKENYLDNSKINKRLN